MKYRIKKRDDVYLVQSFTWWFPIWENRYMCSEFYGGTLSALDMCKRAIKELKKNNGNNPDYTVVHEED